MITQSRMTIEAPEPAHMRSPRNKQTLIQTIMQCPNTVSGAQATAFSLLVSTLFTSRFHFSGGLCCHSANVMKAVSQCMNIHAVLWGGSTPHTTGLSVGVHRNSIQTNLIYRSVNPSTGFKSSKYMQQHDSIITVMNQIKIFIISSH